MFGMIKVKGKAFGRWRFEVGGEKGERSKAKGERRKDRSSEVERMGGNGIRSSASGLSGL